MTSVKTLHAGCTKGLPQSLVVHSIEKPGGERLVLSGLRVEAATALMLPTGGAKLRSTFIHFGGLLGSDDDEKSLRDELRAADVLLLTGREAVRAIKRLNDPLLRLAPKATLGWLLHPDVVGEIRSRDFNYIQVSEAARKHLKIPDDLDFVGFWLRQFGEAVETALVNPQQGGLLRSPRHWVPIPRPSASALDEALFEQAFAAGYMNSRFLNRNCIQKAVCDAVVTAVQASRRA